jgi:hypothetical protein
MSTEEKNLEDILNAFSMETKLDDETLRSYLSVYPQYADELLDLVHEIRCTESLTFVETEPFVDAKSGEAWSRFVNSGSTQEAAAHAAAFGEKLGTQVVAVAKALNVPRSIVVALRDRLVVPTSIPKAFVMRLSNATASDVRSVLEYLANPPQLAPATQFKSDQKPKQQGQVAFADLIAGTEMEEEDRQALLKDFGADGPQ